MYDVFVESDMAVTREGEKDDKETHTEKGDGCDGGRIDSISDFPGEML